MQLQTISHTLQLLEKKLEEFSCCLSPIHSHIITYIHTGSAKYLFFGKCFKKTNWLFSQISVFYLKVESFRLIMENNFIQMCEAVFHQWHHEYCPWKRQLSLACRRNTYLWRHPTNNSPTVSNRSSEVAKRHQLCGC